jgi:acetolactate synthase-1/2/3 large subunit
VAGAVLREALLPHAPAQGESPDFVLLAEAYGAKGLRVEDKADVEPALKEAFKEKKVPVLIDFIVEEEENVFPMVAPGGSIDEMLGGIPGGPVSEMLDDEALEEVWE